MKGLWRQIFVVTVVVPVLQWPAILLSSYDETTTPFVGVDAVRVLPLSRHHWNGTSHDATASTHRRTRVHVDVPTSSKDHLVTDLPLLSKSTFPTQHWAGHLPASPTGEKYFFYWLFAPDDSSDSNHRATKGSEPLIIWLNGGPACSSMDGLFIENGPFRLTQHPSTKAYEITADPYSWHRLPAYTLYIDQPVGTGLSFTTNGQYPTNDHEVNVDMYFFLQQFFTLHSDKFVTDNRLNRPFYFSGESYAGHYIPSIMNFILKENTQIEASSTPQGIVLPVSGGAIGNGWTDPYYQYSGADFAFGQALIGMSEVAALQAKEKQCQASLNQGVYSNSVCFDLIDDILRQSHGQSASTKASGYDVRKSESVDGDRSFPPGHKVVETYLGGAALPANDGGSLSTTLFTKVLAAIHASAATAAGQTYEECTDPPYNALAANDGKGVVDDVIEILNHPSKVQLLFFNGVHDMVCNHVSNEKFLSMLPWDHTSDWMKAERYAWLAEGPTGDVSGYMREYENLQFLKILNAGHMVPMDVPSVALEMMRVFTSHGDFRTSRQKLSRSTKEDSCPLCPTCETRDSAAASSNVPPNGERDYPKGVVVISYAWFVVIVGLVSVGVLVTVVSRRRGTVVHREIPQYELELRDSSSYSDSVGMTRIATSSSSSENGHTVT